MHCARAAERRTRNLFYLCAFGAIGDHLLRCLQPDSAKSLLPFAGRHLETAGISWAIASEHMDVAVVTPVRRHPYCNACGHKMPVQTNRICPAGFRLRCSSNSACLLCPFPRYTLHAGAIRPVLHPNPKKSKAVPVIPLRSITREMY